MVILLLIKKLSNCFIYKYLDVMITIFNNTKKKEIHKKFFAASSFSGSQATRTRKNSQKYLFYKIWIHFFLIFILKNSKEFISLEFTYIKMLFKYICLYNGYICNFTCRYIYIFYIIFFYKLFYYMSIICRCCWNNIYFIY